MAQRFTSKTVLEVIAVSDEAVRSALVELWMRQTVDERESERTKWLNERGFNIPDGVVLGTAVGNFVETGLLTIPLDEVRRRLAKYRRQLYRIWKNELPPFLSRN